MLGEARIGTSGFSHPEWVGAVYPPGLGAQDLLAHYAQLLGTVEISQSFQRAPGEELLASWARAVPPGFQFSLKLPRRITHDLRLAKAAARAFATFLEAVEELGEHLGPLLLQLPPTFTSDTRALSDFLRGIPRGQRLAFEFRHPSWFTPATLRILSAHDAAMVLSDYGEGVPRMELTADFAYVRIRREDDRQQAWDEWAERLANLTRRGIDVFAYVKHDRRGAAVERARRLAALLRNEEQSADHALLT